MEKIIIDPEFILDFYKIFKSGEGEHLNDRRIYITVTKANYGKPSCVVVEVEGSNPKTQIFWDLKENAVFVRLYGSEYKELKYYTYWEGIGGRKHPRGNRVVYLLQELMEKHQVWS